MEKIGSSTQVDQDNFKAIVEKFTRCIKKVDKKLESQIKLS